MRRLVENLRHLVRIEVERVLRLQLQPRLGNIIAYDPNMHAARVSLQPEGIETGWIPVHSPHVGNGYGEVIPLTIGQQVKVGFPEYGSNQGVVDAQVFDERNQVPVAAQGSQAGERIMVGGTGSLFALTNDGCVRINGSAQNQLMASGSMIIQGADGSVMITDGFGNQLAMNASGITATDRFGNQVLMNQHGIRFEVKAGELTSNMSLTVTGS